MCTPVSRSLLGSGLFTVTPVSELSLCVDLLFVKVCEHNLSTRGFACLFSSTYDTGFEARHVLTRSELHSLMRSIKIPETVFCKQVVRLFLVPSSAV